MESAFFYTKGTSTLDDSHDLGSGSTTTVKGGKRINVDITTGGKFDFVIPGPELKTSASVDVKTRYLIEETIRLMNARQEAGLTQLVTYAANISHKVTAGATAFVAITEAMAVYKRDNAKSAHKPTGILVSSAFWADLLQDNKYIRSTDRADLKVFDGQILEVAGVPVIEAQDLTTADFVIVNYNGVAAPMNIANFKMVPADFGGGTAYIGGERGLGEIGYNFKIVTSADEGFLAQDVVLSANIANGDATVTIADTDKIHIGMAVSGTGIPAGTTVDSITDGTDFELSANATVTNASAELTFSNAGYYIAKVTVPSA
jgi:hypothetical protein